MCAMKRLTIALFLALLSLAPRISLAAMQKLDGFIPLYWDEDAGKLFMEIPRFNEEFL